VLERPVREELTCEVTTPLANLGFGWSHGALAPTANGARFAWRLPSETAMPDSVVTASVDETGAPGVASPVALYTGAYSSHPRLAASARGTSVAWVEAGANQMHTMRIAELDAAGAVSKPAATVAGLSERLSAPELVATTDGHALLFVNTVTAFSSSRVRFARLDADAAVVGDIVDVATAETSPQTGAFVELPTGFAATYTYAGSDAETHLVFLDAEGRVQGEPVVLGSARPGVGQSLLVRGDELIVAYGGEDGSYGTSDVAGYIGLARFELSTRALAAPVVRVQSPTVHREATHPVLFAMGQDIGLLWSRGSVIYVCGGCMPDNHLELVVMDGDDFTPVTELLTIPNLEPMGGFVHPLIAPVGAHLAVAATLQFHIAGAAASGAVRCTSLP
jgi:hypothetical protein